MECKMTSRTTNVRIPTKISADVLDQIGRDFTFSHAKGIAEWLKNSLDAYLVRRAEGQELLAGSWPVHLHLMDGQGKRPGPNLAVVDFCGATHADVNDFLLNWFDTAAARRHSRASLASLTGGHGNGGKFYMREMWAHGARFCTWLGGRTTSLIVDHASDGTCGYWELENERHSWREALAAGFTDFGLSANDIEEFITDTDPTLITDLENGTRGFSVVAGLSGRQIWTSNDVVSGRRWKLEKLIESVRVAPTGYRPLRELQIRVAIGGKLAMLHLNPEQIEEDPDWPERTHHMPSSLPGSDGLGEVKFSVADGKDAGLLTIRKAGSPLTGRRRQVNQITVFDSNGNPVGAFPISELAAGNADHTTFLFGELSVMFADIEDFVENDRESFRRAPQVGAIREWLRDKLAEFIDDIEDQARAAERDRNLDHAVQLNQMLNDYARRFLQQLESEVFIDWLDEPGGGEGGMGAEETGGDDGNDGQGGGDIDDSNGKKDKPGNTQRTRRYRFPRILLSGHSEDPASPDHTRELTAGHPPIYQNEQDLRYNVWWINTNHPYAREAFSKGVNSNAWKEYHLFMFRDVVQIEHLRLLQRRDADMELDLLENELIRRSGDFLSSITRELAEEVLA